MRVTSNPFFPWMMTRVDERIACGEQAAVAACLKAQARAEALNRIRCRTVRSRIPTIAAGATKRNRRTNRELMPRKMPIPGRSKVWISRPVEALTGQL